MRIAVCIKSVPDPNKTSDIKFDPVTKNVIRDNLEMVINPTDLHAIELAMTLKERTGAEVVLFSMGPPAAQKQLRDGLSYGTDSAYLLSDRAFGGADSLATAYTLAKAIAYTGPFDLILTGNESSDGGTTQVASQLGEWLGLPHLMEIVKAEYTDGSMKVQKKMDDDFADFEVALPAVLAVSKAVNKVRYPNIKGIMQAKKKPLTVLGAADLPGFEAHNAGSAGSPTSNGDLLEFSFERGCVEYAGTPEEIAKQILDRIRPYINV
ncbi:MAG: electron transfer flavoprotein subunit beta/FixA family protein [Oscillospiraceae bacterium]|nr:electron transfer flavoprotein subunit beta/FixA family protein [Oscillospiraceae bacterium]